MFVFFLLGFSLTEEEVWRKLSAFVDEELMDDNNNVDGTTHIGERHCANHHTAATKTALLGKRHSVEDQSTADVSLIKRHCVNAEVRHSADLIIETTLLGERHSADRRGISVFGADPSNTSLRRVFRSLSTGIIQNLRSMSPPPDRLVGLRRIIGSGGALVRNCVMRKAVKDMYNLPLIINSQSDTRDSAVGAAIAAGRFL